VPSRQRPGADSDGPGRAELTARMGGLTRTGHGSTSFHSRQWLDTQCLGRAWRLRPGHAACPVTGEARARPARLASSESQRPRSTSQERRPPRRGVRQTRIPGPARVRASASAAPPAPQAGRGHVPSRAPAPASPTRAAPALPSRQRPGSHAMPQPSGLRQSRADSDGSSGHRVNRRLATRITVRVARTARGSEPGGRASHCALQQGSAIRHPGPPEWAPGAHPGARRPRPGQRRAQAWRRGRQGFCWRRWAVACADRHRPARSCSRVNTAGWAARDAARSQLGARPSRPASGSSVRTPSARAGPQEAPRAALRAAAH
jgi:hypothetical protein